MTPKEFLAIKKLRLAMHRFSDVEQLSEIAYELDFTDLSHFNKFFKKYVLRQIPWTNKK